MKKGILLIALGHRNYKQMANVLAASIRVNDPGLSITLCTDEPIDQSFSQLFDQVKTVPENMYTVKGQKEYIKAKLFAYDLSPYDETIFLDVDLVLIMGKQLSPVFNELAAIDITFSNQGPSTFSIWADLAEVKKIYGEKEFWSLHSEFFYFKKTKEVKNYFKTAQKAFDADKIKSAHKFGGATMADELAFNIASMITGIYPHKKDWLPNFWSERDSKNAGKYPYQLKEYITYSIGGHISKEFVKKNYNNLAAYYFSKLKLQKPYQAKDKRSFLPERKKA